MAALLADRLAVQGGANQAAAMSQIGQRTHSPDTPLLVRHAYVPGRAGPKTSGAQSTQYHPGAASVVVTRRQSCRRALQTRRMARLGEGPSNAPTPRGFMNLSGAGYSPDIDMRGSVSLATPARSDRTSLAPGSANFLPSQWGDRHAPGHRLSPVLPTPTADERATMSSPLASETTPSLDRDLAAFESFGRHPSSRAWRVGAAQHLSIIAVDSDDDDLDIFDVVLDA